MNKADLIDCIAYDTGMTKREAEAAVVSILGVITNTMRTGDDVTLQGFGTFSVKTRAARIGRNPQTGEAMEIPASQYVSFKPSKALKDAVN